MRKGWKSPTIPVSMRHLTKKPLCWLGNLPWHPCTVSCPFPLWVSLPPCQYLRMMLLASLSAQSHWQVLEEPMAEGRTNRSLSQALNCCMHSGITLHVQKASRIQAFYFLVGTGLPNTKWCTASLYAHCLIQQATINTARFWCNFLPWVMGAMSRDRQRDKLTNGLQGRQEREDRIWWPTKTFPVLLPYPEVQPKASFYLLFSSNVALRRKYWVSGEVSLWF